MGASDQEIRRIAWQVMDERQGIVFVADYGVSGDGSDETSKIQQAIDALPVGGIVYFPKGTYRTSSTLIMISGVTLMGAGIDITIIAYSGSGVAISMSGTVATNKVKMGISGISVVATGSGTTGVEMSYTSYCMMVNADVRGGFTNGIFGEHGNENQFIQVFSDSNTQDGFNLGHDFNNITLLGCQGTGNTRAGLFCDGSRQVLSASCAWEANAYGAYVSSTSAHRSKAVTFENCYFEGNSTREVHIEKGTAGLIPRGTTIRDCLFTFIAAKAATAIYVQDADGLVIDGCTFDDAGGTYTNSLFINTTGSVSGVVYGLNKDTSTAGISAGLPYHDVRKTTARAWGRFTVAGAAIATSNVHNCAVSYVSTGRYRVTLLEAMSGTNYAPVATAENGAVYGGTAMLCGCGVPSSTTVFDIYTASDTATAAEARTVAFNVFA